MKKYFNLFSVVLFGFSLFLVIFCNSEAKEPSSPESIHKMVPFSAIAEKQIDSKNAEEGKIGNLSFQK